MIRAGVGLGMTVAGRALLGWLAGGSALAAPAWVAFAVSAVILTASSVTPE
jgi:hypothetical protein